MAQQAYICLTDDNDWAVVTGDGVQQEVLLLAVGRPFEPGADIRDAVAELQDWATANGYELITPPYGECHVSLQDLIEPEIYDEVFRDQDDQ